MTNQHRRDKKSCAANHRERTQPDIERMMDMRDVSMTLASWAKRAASRKQLQHS